MHDLTTAGHWHAGSGGGGGPYDAADRSRLRDPRTLSYHANNDFNLLSGLRLWKLRRASAHLLRNNPVARAVVTRLQGMVVGSGPTANPGSPDSVWNDRARDVWEDWAAACTACGRHSIARVLADDVLAIVRDGESFDRIIEIDNRPALLACDAELVVDPSGAHGLGPMTEQRTGGKLRRYGGVVVEETTLRPVLYTIGRYPPMQGTHPVDITEYDAASVLHLTNPFTTPRSQVRGEPALTAAVLRLERLDLLDRDVTAAYSTAAQFAMVRKTDDVASAIEALGASSLTGPGLPAEGINIVNTDAGMMHFISRDDELHQVAPNHPRADHDRFVLSQLTQVCADMGVPVPIALLDFSRVNFSAARSALSVAYTTMVAVWRETLAAAKLRRLYKIVVAKAIVDGRLEHTDGWERVSFGWPPMPMLDMAQEIEALDKARKSGLLTDRELFARFLGGDYREVYRQLESERNERIDRGIQKVLEPGAVTETAAPTAQPAGQIDGPGPEPDPEPRPDEEPDDDDDDDGDQNNP